MGLSGKAIEESKKWTLDQKQIQIFDHKINESPSRIQGQRERSDITSLQKVWQPFHETKSDECHQHSIRTINQTRKQLSHQL